MHIILSPLSVKLRVISYEVSYILNMHHYGTRCLKNEFKLNDTLYYSFCFHISISFCFFTSTFPTSTS